MSTIKTNTNSKRESTNRENINLNQLIIIPRYGREEPLF